MHGVKLCYDHVSVAGIVTTADVVHVYGEMAMPFFQLGELDRSLRRVIARNSDLEQVSGICGRRIQSFDELSMGEYQRVLGDLAVWTALGWPLDRATFIERLNSIRQIRNDVMHFNPIRRRSARSTNYASSTASSASTAT